jgi:hypothetical protein
LDETADVFNQVRGGTGGRFYERDGEFFNADGKSTFVRVASVNVKAEGVSGLWERVASSVVAWTRGKPGLVCYTIPARRSQIGTSATNRAHFQVHQQPALCPVHHIELPANGRCDDCT